MNYNQFNHCNQPIDDAFHGQVCIPVVFKCLSLSVGVLLVEPPHESILPNLIMPSLNELTNNLRLLNTLNAYLQTVLIESL
jgi:hypothetical protein